MNDIEKLPLTSKDVNEDRIDALRALFPEAFKDGTIDWPTMQRTLGEWTDPGKERFGLNWPGKAECMKIVQQPSVGTLLPLRDESLNFDLTENLIIEGDNLEVLKLLQKSYYGQVKMIYIDPPYNSGNDFIYPDNFDEGLQDYLRYSGQVDEEGLKLSTNTEADGRYHSKWLSMMYPRLFLAKNLLKDDGIIFVSISDKEVHTLKAILAEIFGEENFLAQFVWVNEGNIDNQSKIKTNHEYILAYAKNESLIASPPVVDPNIPKSSKIFNEFIENTIVKNGPANPVSAVTLPVGFPVDFNDGSIEPGQVEWPKFEATAKVKDGKLQSELVISSGWSSKELLQSFIDNKFQEIKDQKGQSTVFFLTKNGTPYLKKKRTEKPSHILTVLEGMGTVQASSAALAKLDITFPYPKPIELIGYLIRAASGDDDIILDFFAGSGTTAHAVLEQNAAESTNRKFILVQLPEKTNGGPYESIAALTRDRVRKAAKASENLHSAPVGFKSLKLASSNFKVWVSDSSHPGDINKTLQLFADHVDAERKSEDILFELLLKSGYPLTAKVEKLTLASKEVFSVSEGALLICLDRALTLEVIEAMVEKDPARIICLDEGFKGNDQLKVNAVQTVKSRNQNEETDIVFRVV